MFKVFYHDYVSGAAISSAQPEPLAADRIAPLAEALLQCADNFLGVMDKQGLVLQAYLDDDEQSVFLELLYPDDAGAMRLKLACDEAMALLAVLPDEFDESLLPGAQFIQLSH